MSKPDPIAIETIRILNSMIADAVDVIQCTHRAINTMPIFWDEFVGPKCEKKTLIFLIRAGKIDDYGDRFEDEEDIEDLPKDVQAIIRDYWMEVDAVE